MAASGAAPAVPLRRTRLTVAAAVVAVLALFLLGSMPAGATPVTAPLAGGPHAPTFDRGSANLLAAQRSLAAGAGPARGSAVSCTGASGGVVSCGTAAPAAPHPLASATPVWTNLTPSMGLNYPANRWIASMAYDPVDQYVVLFGGYGGSLPCFSDTWAFQNGAWTQLSPSLSPSGRYASVMTWDAKDGYLLLFSGYASFGSSLGVANDTWTFLHGQWTNVTNYSAAPPARWRAVMAYDPVDQYVVMFGGTDLAGTPYSDTWKYVGGNWTKLTVSGSPPGRYRAEATWDVADGYLVVFGGCTSSTCPTSDTWTYVNATWKQVSPATHPAAREYVGITYDAAEGYVVLFGGTDGSTTFYSDTWSYLNGTWTSLTEATHPVKRAYLSMAYDAYDGYALLFGGATTTSSGYENDTWALGPSVLGTLRASPSTIDIGQSTQLNATPVAYSGYTNFTWSTLPSGCAAGNVSVVVCTPNATGTFPVDVAVNDANGVPLLRNTTIVVNSDPAITSFNVTPAAVTSGSPVLFSLVANGGGTLPYSMSYANLPAGCSSRDASSLTCSPSAAGSYPVNATLSDGAGWHAHATAVLTVNPRPSFVTFTAVPPTIDVGQTSTFYANVSGGTAPLAYAYSGLPAGCSTFDLAAIGCTPSGSGVVTIGVTVVDAFGWNATDFLTLTVNPALTVSAFALSAPAIDVGQPLKIWLNASGGTGALSYSFGGLPGGCTPVAAAATSCVPTATGAFTLTGTATDSLGFAVVSQVALTVNPDPLVSYVAISPSSIDIHQTVTINATVTGGTAPISYHYAGLPTGCASANQATIACQPAAAGSFSVVVSITDRWGQASQLGAAFVVNLAPSVSSFSASATDVATGSSTTLTVVASGGSGSYTFVYSGLPTGCASANTSTLTCTPTTTGLYAVTVVVTDSLGVAASAGLNLSVSAPSASGGFLGLSGSLGYVVVGVLVAVIVVIAAVALLMRRRRPAPATEAEAPPEYIEGEAPP